MNTHETYVSLETAKLLKEAGFDWECLDSYISTNEIKWEGPIDWHHSGTSYNFNGRYYDGYNTKFISAPTLAVVQKWLREVKEYSVFCTPTTRTKWCFIIMCPDTQLLEHAKDYDTYESALEAGIKKCLEIILGKDE